VVATAVEHPAVLETLGQLEREGFETALAPVDREGRLDLDGFVALLDGAPCAAATAMWVNNETGAIQDVAALGAACRARGVAFHVDGVQAVGRLPISVGELPIDTLALSAHKLHGPKGVGALYVKRGLAFRALLFGGSQEGGRRAGTENVPGIAGLGRAAELALANLGSATEVARLRDRLEQGLLAAVDGVSVNGAGGPRIGNTANLTFEGVSGEALVALLSELGVCASTGAACASGKQAPSHVLLAMGLSPGEASSSLRLSLSRTTTETEVEAALRALVDAVGRLRAVARGSARAAGPG
jgi:cysteine desulfurase